MPLLLLKDLPRYECLLDAAKEIPELDPSACEVFLHLLRAGDEVSEAMERSFSDNHVSHGRFSVLMLLWNSRGKPGSDAEPDDCSARGPRTPAELADAAGVTRATMTGLIDTLERDGLVRREPDPIDRRMMSVVLTARAESFLRQMLPSHFRLMASLMLPLTESERKTLVHLLNKILQHATMLSAASRPVPVGIEMPAT